MPDTAICPYCQKQISTSATTCLYCLRDLPTGFGKEFDFDFSLRFMELVNIREKWLPNPMYESTYRFAPAMGKPLQDYFFELIDEGHKPGEETIKRNFELAEETGRITADFIISGLCLGLEFGSNGKQVLPIPDEDPFPKEVSEMFVVSLQNMYALYTNLLFDIYSVKKIDESYMKTKMDGFNAVALGVLVNCYRLGAATAKGNK
jgi:hypothetical protein